MLRLWNILEIQWHIFIIKRQRNTLVTMPQAQLKAYWLSKTSITAQYEASRISKTAGF